MKNKLILPLLLLLTVEALSQPICNQNGNLAIFSNYDGGIVTIDVDQNIPNLVIAICTYEPVQVTLTGAFVGNVTQVIYAGMNSNQNNDNCGLGNFTTSVTGVPAGIVSINPPMTPPLVGFTPAHGNGTEAWGGLILGSSGQCDTLSDAGGVNTPDEIVYYFETTTNSNLLFHNTQYGCWQNSTFTISQGGNCCIEPSLSSGCNLAATVTVEPNSLCEPCFYSGPPILINELMISPTSGDGSISGPAASGGRGEWIELYNPDLCDSVDISCYYLGNNTPEGTGGFRLPQGTVIPPNGYCMVRGVNVAPVPTNLLLQNGGNVVEIVIPAEITDIGVCCSGTRVWFPNAGGWFAFYDANGNPIDAVRWGPGNTASLAGQPCTSTQGTCSTGASLLSYNDIPTALKFYASTADGSSHFGQSIRRMPDGGSWSGIGQPTYAICNDPLNCLTGTIIGSCNGQGTVNVTSGTPPFTYQWDDDLNQTTQTATNLCEGVYQVVVTDADNCQETYSINVITAPFDITTTVQQPSCQQSDGSITFDPFDPNYTYTWSPAVSTTNSANNLAQGTYTISIQQGFCSQDTTITLQNPVPFTTTALTVQTTCGLDNGSISITNTPTGNYTYSWSPNVSTLNSASSLPAGNYQISISDNVCVFDTTITVLSSLPLTSTATIYNSTCEQANGAADLDVSPAGSYTFIWSGNVSSTIDSASNLAAGTYQISFTDGICVGDTTITLTTTSPITDITANVIPTRCDINTGEITVTSTSGGVSPYTYAIDNGAFSGVDTFDSLAEGSYTISVTDVNNCTYDEQVAVSMFAGPTAIQYIYSNPDCGLDNGTLFINGATGGTSPYSYDINGVNLPSQDTLNDIAVGVYSVGVVDANGCSFYQPQNFIMTAGETSIKIPNVLTANNDQTNDIWKVTTVCIESISCIIINRWGNKIYEFSDINGSWDGKTASGDDADNGVFFYELTANYFDGSSEVFHGHITLIR